MIGINNLSVEFSAKPLFSNISFSINDNDRLALVGKNGAGKSTLLKIISGQQQPTAGSVALPNDITIGYLPQEMLTTDDTTLFDETKKAFSERIKLEERLEEITAEIASRNDHDSEDFLKLLSTADDLRNSLQVRFPENMDAEIEKTLIGLGFKQEDFNRPTSEFSGGWRMRIELAKILLRKPELLLLDEPTNHLDINSIQWLENFLVTKAGAVVLVSHDRAFLDNVTKRTIEISCGKIYDYKASYTPFQALRKERIETQLKAFENQQKLIAETKDFIERFRYKATKAVQVQSRIKQLEKIVPIEIDEEDTSSVNFKFPPAERSGDFPVITDELGKSYGTHRVFSAVNFTMRRGEKVALVGSNGEGKSTFVKCVMSEIPYDGALKIGHNIKIGYFAQNQAQLLDTNKTVFETVDDVAVGDIRTRLKDLLAAFLFRGEDIDKKVSVLSGGEKTRLAMAKLLLEPVNFLILDEPTNHLDMRTKEVLKKALKDFNGTVIIVSHDRDFLDGLVDKVYEFGGGKVREYLGGIYDYLRERRVEASAGTLKSQNSDDKKVEDNPVFPDEKVSSSNDSPKTLTYQQKKEFDRQLRKAEKIVSTIENEIENIESLILELEEKMSQGIISDEIMKEYSDKKRLLDSKTEEWDKAQTELDTLKSQL
ncbi:MAG: ABC-F family ATP-binding cassette domain-containing protein [Muribaculaceae bacterium]|nr:ABC-F family ATP-binding cassette domain-containing protein [Muribaculaceae bacterium]